jgi:hypothetical protein
MWRTLTKDALLKRAIECQQFFEAILQQKPNLDWAIQGVVYAKRFQRYLELPQTNLTRCEHLGRAAQKRFRLIHPPILPNMGKDLVRWVRRERRLRGER